MADNVEIDYDKLAAAQTKAMRSAGLGGTGAGLGAKEIVEALAIFRNPATAITALGLGEVQKAVSGSVSEWQKASDVGIGLQRNFLGFSTSIAQTKLDVDEFMHSVKLAGPGFAGLAGGVSASSQAFALASTAFSKSDASDQLRDLGYTTEAYNDILALTMDRATNIDLKEKTVSESVILRAQELGQEMAALSDATGMSRKQMTDQLSKDKENASIQAALASMPAKANAEFQKMSVVIGSTVGPGLSELGKQIFAQNGVLTTSQQTALSMFGPAGEQYKKAMTDLRLASESGDPERIKAAQDGVIRAVSSISNEMGPDSRLNKNLQQAALYTGEYGKNLQQYVASGFIATQSIREAAAKQKVSVEQYIRDMLEKAKTAAPTKAGETGTPQEVASGAMIRAQARAEDAGVRWAQTLDKSTTELGRFIEKMTEGTNLLGAQIAGGNLGSGRFSSGGRMPGFVPENEYRAVENLARGNVVEAGKDFLKGVKEGLSGVWNMTAQAVTVMSSGKINVPKVEENPHSAGSPGIADFLSGSGLGDIGKVFENFGSGTPATLHGMETVMRPEQLASVINKSSAPLQGALSDVISNFRPEQMASLVESKVREATATLTTALPNAVSNMPPVNPSVFEEMRSQLAMLNTTMSSQLRDIASTMDKQYRATKNLSGNIA